VLTKMAGLGDIRTIGSGNIGATNVLRTGNKFLAALTLVLDGGKGAIAVLGLGYAFPDAPTLSLMGGFAAVLGHNFPVWLKFKGGKGVATTLGTLVAASPMIGIAACATWLAVAAIFRISSLSALVALGLSPVFAWFWVGPDMATLAAALAVLSFIRHHQNIRRLMKGEEPRIGRSKSKSTPKADDTAGPSAGGA